MLTIKDNLVWIDAHGYVDMNDIVRFDGDMVFTMDESIQVPSSVCVLLQAAHREHKVREVLAKILKVSDVPKNVVNLMPENSLAYVAGEAKALLQFLGE